MARKNELIGIPSGEIFYVFNFMRNRLESYGYIYFDKNINYWCYQDYEKDVIKRIIEYEKVY